MKIGIVGGGPYGTYLSCSLAKEGHEVVLYEMDYEIRRWWPQINKKRVRVLLDHLINTFDFFTEIGVEYNQNFKKIHDTFMTMFGSLPQFSTGDLSALSIAYAYPSLNWYSHTVKSVCDTYSISTKGKARVDEVCVKIHGVSYDRLSAVDFFDEFDNKINGNISTRGTQNALKDVEIRTGHTFKKFIPYHNIAEFCVARKQILIHHDKLFVCTPPNQLSKIVRYEGNDVLYTGIEVFFYFNSPVEYVRETVGEWCIIKTHSNHSVCIKTVITEFNTRSTHTNKTVNDSTKDEILAETWRQLNNNCIFPSYRLATIYNSTRRWSNEGAWEHINGVYYRHASGDVMHTEITDGINYVNCHNSNAIPFTSHSSAKDTAETFVNKHFQKRPFRFMFVLTMCGVIAIYRYSLKHRPLS